MKTKMTLEANLETVDLSRRKIMARVGLVACAVPVLMTMSTSAQAAMGAMGQSKSSAKANGGIGNSRGLSKSSAKRGIGSGKGQGRVNGSGLGVQSPDVTSTEPDFGSEDVGSSDPADDFFIDVGLF